MSRFVKGQGVIYTLEFKSFEKYVHGFIPGPQILNRCEDDQITCHNVHYHDAICHMQDLFRQSSKADFHTEDFKSPKTTTSFFIYVLDG